MSSHLPDRSRLSWGVASASYQVEGATGEDGRGVSIWDTFAARPRAVVDGREGAVRCASYTPPAGARGTATADVMRWLKAGERPSAVCTGCAASTSFAASRASKEPD